jgi:inorganic pyrophosphatase
VIYPYDYGYLENTQAGDGQGIDVWVGSLPDKALTAVVCTIDLAKRDAEIKILLGCIPQEAQTIVAFHRGSSAAALLLERLRT